MHARRFGSVAAILGSLLLPHCTFPDYVAEDLADGAIGPLDVGFDSDAVVDAHAEVDAPDVSADTRVDGDSLTDVPADGACEPVKQFNFPVRAAVGLECRSSTILDVTLPVGTEGLVFARANLTLSHAAIPKLSYSWIAKVEVGAEDADQIAFSSGDDLCPSVTTSKVVGGYGRVDAANNHVRLSAQQSAVLCSTGTVTVGAASSIDVWVESARPGCAHQAIVVASYLALMGTTGTSWDWPAGVTLSPILTAKIETKASDTSLLTIAMFEGTVTTNPNSTCGAETHTLTAETTLDGTVLSTSKLPMPATTSQGHLLLDTFHQEPVTAGPHTLQLLGSADFRTSKVTTGGTGGDALLAIIRK